MCTKIDVSCIGAIIDFLFFCPGLCGVFLLGTCPNMSDTRTEWLWVTANACGFEQFDLMKRMCSQGNVCGPNITLTTSWTRLTVNMANSPS